MLFLTRWDDDTAAPPVRYALKDLAVRAVLPAVGLFVLMTGLGLIVMGPLGGLKGENDLNRSLEAGRTPTWNGITHVLSSAGNTEYVIGLAVLVAIAVFWRTRRWWFSVVPLVAISLQSLVFVSSAAIVGRDRPEVERMDPTPPTASFPSGHTSAATALWTSMALLAMRIENKALRTVVVALCLTVPVLVAAARVYRGAHHVTDVLAGLLNGGVCAVLAWRWLHRDQDTSERALPTRD